jgi:hypothetical protein
MSKGHGKRRAIRSALGRLGMQARPAEVVAHLSALGVTVSQEQVRAVAAELLRQAARAERLRVEARTPDVPRPHRGHPRLPPRRGRGR